MKTKSSMKTKIMLLVSLFVLAGVATQQDTAAAVEMPAFDRLTPLTEQVRAPADVAVDQQGRIYVAETTKNRIAVLSQSGRYTGRMLTDVSSPISVAVDAAGRIYVGNNGNGSVAVFSSDLSLLFKLGSGNGEFGKPSDIAIDAAGKIYVADKSNNAINTYNTSGAKTGSIGTPGNGDGQLHHPTSIGIDENGGELVVLDHQQILDSHTGKMIDGARVQFFNKADGSFLRGFSKFGYNNAGMTWDPVKGMYTQYDITMGQLTKPNQVTVDSLGRVYVTDARLQKVMVYEVGPDLANPAIENLNYLGTIDSVTSPLRIPIGIAFGASNRLYVTNLRPSQVGQVEVFGVDNYTAMVASPADVAFSVIENAPAPPPKAASISNLGNSAFGWTASSPDSWISLGATSGTLASPGTESIEISVNPAGFAPGTHTGKVVVNTAAGTEEINVALTVEPNPLQVIGGPLNFTTTVGTTASSQSLSVTSTAPTPLNWSAFGDQGWISLNKYQGITSDTINVYVDDSLASQDPSCATLPCTLNGTITVVELNSATVTAPVPETVDVSFTLTESTDTPEDHPEFGEGGDSKWNKKWTVTQVPGVEKINLNGVSGTSSSDVFAVGDMATALLFDGKDWNSLTAVTKQPETTEPNFSKVIRIPNYNSVWAYPSSSAYIVDNTGNVQQYDGTSLTTVKYDGGNSLQDIWGYSSTGIQSPSTPAVANMFTVDEFGTIFLDSNFSSYDSVGVALRTTWGGFVAGEEGAIFSYTTDTSSVHSDITDTFVPMTSNTTEWINGLWGSSSTDVFAVGENGTIVHYDGNAEGTWTAMDSGTSYNLNGICGTSANNVYAVGDNSLILHYNGKEWSGVDAGAGVALNDAWCAKKDIFIVGDNGTIIHGQGKGFPWLRLLPTLVENGKKLRDKEQEETE